MTLPLLLLASASIVALGGGGQSAVASASTIRSVDSPQQQQQQQHQHQIPFGVPPTSQQPHYVDHQSSSSSSSPSTSTSSPTPLALHRLCLQPSKADEYWPTILSSLHSLESTSKSPIDYWTSIPRLIKNTIDYTDSDSEDEDQMGSDFIEESSCIDFTFHDNDLLNELVHAAPRKAELDWSIIADQKELSRRIDKQKSSPRVLESYGQGETPVEDAFHAGYHQLNNITAFLSYQVAQYPNLASMLDLGTTSENRVISGIRLGHKMPDEDGSESSRKEVVIVAGAHGREWITTSVALYLVSALLSDPSLLSTFSVVIVPVLNPDGYTYTWETDRFFRKNRQKTSSGHGWWGRDCFGVDISRNFPVNFRKPSLGGNNPCGPTYPGSEPLSTPESKSLSSLLRGSSSEDEDTEGPIAFIDLHSYGQLILHPWLSCNKTSPTSGEIPNEEDLSELVIGTSRAFKSIHGKSYRVGRGCETMYNQDGSAVDFAYSKKENQGAEIKYAFEFELRDEGSYGFLLPPEQIRPTGQEVWNGVKYLLEFIKKREKLHN